MLTGILGRGVKGDAALYSFPVTLGSSMLRKICLLSCGILPVCIAFGVRACTGVINDIVFVFNITQPTPAIKPCNCKLLKTSFDFPNCLLGGGKRKERVSPGVRKPKPKMCQSWWIVWFLLLRRWYVVKLMLNICFFLLSRCRCLLGCCCESITCFFRYGQWWG